MNKIVIALFALVAVAAAEPPVSYGAPSFSTFSSGGGYDDGGNEGAQIDSALLARVAQILEQSEASSGYSSGPSSSYGAPSNSYGPPSSSYGAPSSGYSRGGGGSGGGIQIGRPERAQRIAEFDISGGNNFRSGGYSGGSSGGYN